MPGVYAPASSTNAYGLMSAANWGMLNTPQAANSVLRSPGGLASPAWGALVAADIPALPASKITSGVMDSARLPDLSGTYAALSHTHPASQISDSTTAGRTLLTAANAAAQRTALSLATVAGTGAYADLSGTPTLGTAASLNAGATTGAASGELLQGGTGGSLTLANTSASATTLTAASTATLTSGYANIVSKMAATGAGDRYYFVARNASGTNVVTINDYGGASFSHNVNTAGVFVNQGTSANGGISAASGSVLAFQTSTAAAAVYGQYYGSTSVVILGATSTSLPLNQGAIDLALKTIQRPLFTDTSGAVASFAITPTYNQTSGTAANTDLLVNRTQTAVGSGTQKLVSLQVGGVEKFGVDNTGSSTQAGSQTFGSSTAGPVVVDATNGNKYRIGTSGGAVTLTAVM